MDIISALILFGFIMVIIFYLNNIRDIIIPTTKSRVEIITIVISMIITLFITFYFGMSIFHYIIGILGTSILALGLFRRGITQNGFQSMRGINSGNWDKITTVKVEQKEQIKISFTTTSMFYDVQYYAKEDYDEILDILLDNIKAHALTIE